MTRPLKEIRKDIYDWLQAEGFELTNERKSHLSSLIREHDDQRYANVSSQINQLQDHMRRCKLARKDKHDEQQRAAVLRRESKT
jgi:hypothetical protein